MLSFISSTRRSQCGGVTTAGVYVEKVALVKKWDPLWQWHPSHRQRWLESHSQLQTTYENKQLYDKDGVIVIDLRHKRDGIRNDFILIVETPTIDITF